MKLRSWQSDCINSAISKFTSSTDSSDFKKHFLALATPGAGKTIMAATLARKMYELGLIDLVLCFSPSSIVSSDFSDELTTQFKTEFNGKVGSLGDAFTYQKLGTLDNDTWKLFDRFRVFVIFDEIHHCAGSSTHDANAWGAPIIEIIREKAAYSIALTGTPWRSDSLPIALSSYCEDNRIQCDYVYGLKQAIADGVCRVPQVIAVDNNKIVVTRTKKQKVYNSFNTLLTAKATSYSHIVLNETVNEQVLSRAIIKLNELRKINSNSGGLVVASSIEHAEAIKLLMIKNYNKGAVVVTTNEARPSDRIKDFRKSSDEWLISVGMVSEGTNIPRLQVCCNLTNITTEMYFRQIFGRVLRKTNAPNQEAYMFMPAEPKLVSYARRMVQDIPDDVAKVQIVKMDEEVVTDAEELTSVEAARNNTHVLPEKHEITVGHHSVEDIHRQIQNMLSSHYLDESEGKQAKGLSYKEPSSSQSGTNIPKAKWSMGIVGKYRQETLKVADIEPFLISQAAKAKLAELNQKLN
ncbi:DEAD/DEAH box helicase [Thalassotalea agarivorans]|uniref:Superfamily II DNA or RNA helicase n=1 Tax=Thalassotalea agarivorans TaxID=349064 RepID=A0A1H9ZKK7_THASX|nr:DEAD/DEAH box helicase family protein [Thalassotalea agarivorans]SES81328.1 Superfamily II DNA or RNA helicase [Thalassotalea agarivorans]